MIFSELQQIGIAGITHSSGRKWNSKRWLHSTNEPITKSMWTLQLGKKKTETIQCCSANFTGPFPHYSVERIDSREYDTAEAKSCGNKPRSELCTRSSRTTIHEGSKVGCRRERAGGEEVIPCRPDRGAWARRGRRSRRRSRARRRRRSRSCGSRGRRGRRSRTSRRARV